MPGRVHGREMLWPLLLLWVSSASIQQKSCDNVFYPEGCASNEISFRRVSHASSTQRRFSVYLYSENGARQTVHALLVFADNVSEFHNALLFNPRRHAQYSETVRESAFRFNNEMQLLSRGRRLLLQYDVAPHDHPYFVDTGDGVVYDAALLLDPHSSMWHEYNVVATERGQLLLRWQDAGASAVDDSAQDFAGLYRLQCDLTHSHKQCLAQAPARSGYRHSANESAISVPGLWVNDVFYPDYQLLLDPSQSVNRLPYALYMRWRYHEQQRALQVGWHQPQQSDLFLSSQFKYEPHSDEQDTRIVIGVDALHYFQRTEHRLYSGQFMLYYSALYQSASIGSTDDTALRLLWLVLLALLLVCITRWLCSSNYTVLHFLLSTPVPYKRQKFKFQYRLLGCEVTAVVVGVLVWILMLVYTPAITRANFVYQHSAFQQRKLLLYIFLLYHLVLAVFLLLVSARAVRKLGRHYWARLRLSFSAEPWQKDYASIKKRATKYTTRMRTELVIARNLVLHTVLATDLLLIFNYKAEAKPLWGYFLVITALAMAYFYVKFLFIATYYLYDMLINQVRGRVSPNPARWPGTATPLLVFIAVSAIVLTLFQSFSVPVIYLDFLYAVNSSYPQALIISFVIFFLVVVAAIPIVLVASVIEAAVTPEPGSKKKKSV